ncbi:hypothetical protein V8G54_029327, partial [Vigna mungo]
NVFVLRPPPSPLLRSVFVLRPPPSPLLHSLHCSVENTCREHFRTLSPSLQRLRSSSTTISIAAFSPLLRSFRFISTRERRSLRSWNGFLNPKLEGSYLFGYILYHCNESFV